MAIEIGTVVYLKSGSPPMTVLEFEDHKRIIVTWFVDQAPKYEAFVIAMLTESAPTFDSACEWTKKFDAARDIASA